MATALSMITRAMRLAGVIGKGETPDANESADGLTALNVMLNSWQTERLSVYQIQTESFTWAANSASRTVGTAGNFATDRPARIDESSAFRQNNVDYPITLIDVDAWSSIADKTTTSELPYLIYPEYGASLVTLYAYPIPSANITFLLRSWEVLQNFSALTTDLALPMGYQRAIEYNLAIEYGPEFGATIQAEVAGIARTAKANIKRINAPTPIMRNEIGNMNKFRVTENINVG